MDTLKRHLPFSGQEGLNELKKIAGRVEEKIYTAATSQVNLIFIVYVHESIHKYLLPYMCTSFGLPANSFPSL